MDMKRKTFLLVFLSLFFADNSFANDGGTCGDNLKWYFDEDEQTLTISGCGYMKDYYPVSNPWDNYRDLIQYVNIKNGVLSIGGHAFADCKNLTNINLPNSVSVIEDFAFSGCNNLNSVTFPSSLREIRYSAFLNCSGLKTINFSEGLRLIAYASFAGCYSLNGITLPSSLEYLGSYAFEGCYKVSDLYCYAVNPPKIIGMQIEDIFVYSPFDSEMKWATLHVSESSINTYRTSGSWGDFRYYEPLSEYDPRPGITIPSSTKCGNNLFWNYSIETNTVTFTGDGAMWDYDTNNLSPWTDYKEELERIIIDDNITHIGNYAFYLCNNIETIDSKLKDPYDIDETVFGEETYRKADLLVPTGKKANYQSKKGWKHFGKILDGARTIHVEKAGTLSNYISEEEKYQIESLKLTGELNGFDLGLLREMAGRSTFTYNYNYYLDDHKTEGKLSFLDISGANIVEGGKIGEYETADTDGEILLTESNVIPRTLFCNCVLKEIILPESLLKIESYSFGDCNNLISVTIPTNVVYIEGYSFSGCYKLKYIRSNIKEPYDIDDKTFLEETYQNAELIVPKGTESAYQSVKGWKNFRMVTSEGGKNEDYGEEFEYNYLNYMICDNNTVSIVPGTYKHAGSLSIPEQVSYKGITYTVSTIGERAFYGNDKLASVVIPQSVTSIRDYAFCGCSGLKTIDIPISVVSIGDYAFSGCNKIVSIDLPSKITEIAEGSFQGCNGLCSIDIPSNVTKIKDYAFQSCVNLISATIPNSVTSIGNMAFEYTALADATFPSSLTSLGYHVYSNNPNLQFVHSYTIEPFDIEDRNVFSNVNIEGCVLYVPDGCYSKYSEANVWKDFLQIWEMEGSAVETIALKIKNFDVYTINGYKIRSKVNSIEDLPKGLYIINGKKIVK